MKIIFRDRLPIVEEAVNKANRLLNNEEFFKGIASYGVFDMSTASPDIIANLMKQSKLEFKVALFRPSIFQAIRYRKTFAFTDERYPDTVFLNVQKLDREVEDIAATLIHESIHALDDSIDAYEFGHGDNSPVGKESTAPYWIGGFAYRMLKGNPSAPLPSFN